VSSIARAKGHAAAVAWLTALKTNASAANVPDSETLTSDASQGTTNLARGNPSSAISHPNSRKCFTPIYD
jgi:hypothetical protein